MPIITTFAKLHILYIAQCRAGKGAGMKINLRHIHDAFNGIYPILFETFLNFS